MRPLVIKLGGSLLSLRGGEARFHRWLIAQARARSVVIVGGGASVKALRHRGNLDDEAAHWASVGLMRENTALVAARYPRSRYVGTWASAGDAWLRGEQPFFDVGPFLRTDDTAPDHLPHTWAVSSDSIAARVAARHDADLILIKSCPVTAGPNNWPDLASQGVVDDWFPNVAPTVPNVMLTNLP